MKTGKMLLAAAILALAGCDDVRIDKRIEVGEPPAPLEASGPAEPLAPEAGPALQQAAAVAEVAALEQGGVKLFGLTGGDPAMNGLHVHIAFFISAAEGWAVFPVTDVLSFRVLDQAPGRVDLEVEESVMDEATGRIGSATRRFILSWSAGPDGAPPATVGITPAA